MAFSQVYNMDVVPDTSSIRGWVIVAKNAELFPFSGYDFLNEREKVVGVYVWLVSD